MTSSRFRSSASLQLSKPRRVNLDSEDDEDEDLSNGNNIKSTTAMDINGDSSLARKRREGSENVSSLLDAMDSPPPPSTNTSQDETSDSPDQPSGSADRHVLLYFHITSRSQAFLSFPEKHIRKIPEYAVKLDKAILKRRPRERMRISDSNIRHRETMLQIFEYLGCGNLASIDAELADDVEDAGRSFLSDLLTLYDASIDLDIPSLQEAVSTRIVACIPRDKTQFPAFAVECYDGGHEVGSVGMLGQQIKRWMAQNLFDPMERDILREIKSLPCLSEQLVDIIMEGRGEWEEGRGKPLNNGMAAIHS